ncbi:MAG: phosphatidylglycerophosphatase A [Aestuariivirga sp.]|uniref:phosphatidylglycerophosphatase A family protein n=1 Tax=Aestuariivirga sp. TaxID=2650926 RepID=UPI0038D16635
MKVAPGQLRQPSIALALSFGLGLIPWSPGSFGAAGAFVIYVLAAPLHWGWQAGLTALLFALGCLACGRAAAALGEEDHQSIVWDETVGMLMVLVLVPPTLLSWLAGFMLFRVFDIVKPWPISAIDRNIHGGLGVMLDDAMAAIPAAVCVWALHLAFTAQSFP